MMLYWVGCIFGFVIVTITMLMVNKKLKGKYRISFMELMISIAFSLSSWLAPILLLLIIIVAICMIHFEDTYTWKKK